MSSLFAAKLPMHKVVSQLRRPFVRDVGILELGGFVALGLNLLLSIVLARVLGREGYGAYALVVSAMTVLSLFKRLGQDYVATTSVAAAYARQDAGSLRASLAAFNVINIWSTLLVIPIAMLVAPVVASWFFKDAGIAEPLRLALLPPIWAMPLATVLVLLHCTRRLALLSAVESANRLALGLFGLAIVLAGGGLNGFFWGQAGASLIFAGVALLIYRRLQSIDPLIPPLGPLLKGVLQPMSEAWRVFRSGLAVALDKNLVSLYPLAPILLLGSQAPTEQVALLRVGMSYLAVPLLALHAVSRLLMVKLPELHATQPARVKPFFLQVTATGACVAIVLTVPFVLLAPWLIGLLYGPDFAAAAALVPLLALAPLTAGFGIAAGPIFRTFHRNLWAVYANLAVLLVGLPLAYLLIHLHGLPGAALAYSAILASLQVVAYVLCFKIVGKVGREA